MLRVSSLDKHARKGAFVLSQVFDEELESAFSLATIREAAEYCALCKSEDPPAPTEAVRLWPPQIRPGIKKKKNGDFTRAEELYYNSREADEATRENSVVDRSIGALRETPAVAGAEAAAKGGFVASMLSMLVTGEARLEANIAVLPDHLRHNNTFIKEKKPSEAMHSDINPALLAPLYLEKTAHFRSQRGGILPKLTRLLCFNGEKNDSAWGSTSMSGLPGEAPPQKFTLSAQRAETPSPARSALKMAISAVIGESGSEGIDWKTLSGKILSTVQGSETSSTDAKEALLELCAQRKVVCIAALSTEYRFLLLRNAGIWGRMCRVPPPPPDAEAVAEADPGQAAGASPRPRSRTDSLQILGSRTQEEILLERLAKARDGGRVVAVDSEDGSDGGSGLSDAAAGEALPSGSSPPGPSRKRRRVRPPQHASVTAGRGCPPGPSLSASARHAAPPAPSAPAAPVHRWIQYSCWTDTAGACNRAFLERAGSVVVSKIIERPGLDCDALAARFLAGALSSGSLRCLLDRLEARGVILRRRVARPLNAHRALFGTLSGDAPPRDVRDCYFARPESLSRLSIAARKMRPPAADPSLALAEEP
jgi:hypothetical protein